MPDLKRYKLTLAYDGSGFHGWAKQHPPGQEPLRTVQEVVERALVELIEPERGKINVLGASRTDSGVHARGQVAQFEAATMIPTERLGQVLANKLPDDVDVVSLEEAPGSFNAIGDVVSKQYRYRVYCERRKPVWLRQYVYHATEFADTTIDIELMRSAASDLVGEHDFAAFTASGHGRQSTVRTVHTCDVELHELPTGCELHIITSGGGYLYNMVRIMAGTILDIGRGRLRYDAARHALFSMNRRDAGPTLPANGLILEWIRYRT
jgi:tRNA pseudouridine38-40 synthase